MQVLVDKEKTLTVKGGTTVKGINFDVYLEHGTNNTDLDDSDLLSENILVSAFLTMPNGQSIPVIPDTNLKVLNMESNIFGAGFGYVSPGVDDPAIVKLEKGASNKEKWLFPMSFEFHYPINIPKGGTLEVKVNNQASSISSNAAAAASFVDVSPEYDEAGYMSAIPVITAKSVNASESNIEGQYSNLTSLTLINWDKTTSLDADATLSSVSFGSERITFTRNYNQLLGNRARKFVNPTEAGYRAQCWQIYNGGLLKQATFNATAVAANINSGKNWVVARTCIVNPLIAELADTKQALHSEKDRAHFGLSYNKGLIQNLEQRKSGLANSFGG